MIIDIHTHIDKEKIYQQYLKKSKNKVAKILVMEWLKSKDLEGLIRFVESKKNLFVAAAINFNKDISQQLESREKLFKENKIIGIKLYPGYQHFYASDPKIYPIATLCQKYNKPLIFHTGDVWDPDNEAILKYSHPIYIDDLAVKFPKCKIILAHLGFPYHLEAANVVSKNKNVYTDISGTLDSPRKDLLNQYIKDLTRVFAYSPIVKEKIMFGTDYSGENTPLKEIDNYIKIVKRVFSPEEQKNVFYKLAEKLFFTD